MTMYYTTDKNIIKERQDVLTRYQTKKECFTSTKKEKPLCRESYSREYMRTFEREDTNRTSVREEKTTTSSSSSFLQKAEFKLLNPLEVGFSRDVSRCNSIDEHTGESLDKMLPSVLNTPKTFCLKIFQHKGKYYSQEERKLWLIKSLHRFSENVQIVGEVGQRPVYPDILCDSLRYDHKIGGVNWKKKELLNGLSTKTKVQLKLADILFSEKFIPDTVNGESIFQKLIETYSSKMHRYELNVIENKNKFYALENEMLWVLKHAAFVRGPFVIIGNVKVCMDDVMFQSFTSDNIRNVDIIIKNSTHSEAGRFMLNYIQNTRKV